jgi:hypothetical protein
MHGRRGMRTVDEDDEEDDDDDDDGERADVPTVSGRRPSMRIVCQTGGLSVYRKVRFA